MNLKLEVMRINEDVIATSSACESVPFQIYYDGSNIAVYCNPLIYIDDGEQTKAEDDADDLIIAFMSDKDELSKIVNQGYYHLTSEGEIEPCSKNARHANWENFGG